MIDMETIFFYDTPVGKLCIGEENGCITHVTWSKIPQEYVLEETELTVGEIMEQMGIEDICHFSKLFKRYYGDSPRKFREMLRLSVKPPSDGFWE